MNEKEIVDKVKKITGNKASDKKIKREFNRLANKLQGEDLVYAIAQKVS